MKKIFALGWMLVAALALTNCSKEEAVAPEMEGEAFEIVASANGSRTTMADLKTTWVSGDAMNVWTATADGYQSHGQFTISDVENGKFTGTLDASFDNTTANDWYVMYPYNAKVLLPDGSNYMYVGHSSPYQNGNNSQAHLSGSAAPLYSVAKNVAGSETPVFQMHHLSTFVRVRVTNNTEAPFSVASVYLTSENEFYLAGSYYVNITGEEVEYVPSGGTYTKSEVTLTVNNGEEIAVGKQAEFYLPLAPIQFGANDEMLTVNIKTTEGATISVEKTIPGGTKFAAGKLNTLNAVATVDNTEYPEPSIDYTQATFKLVTDASTLQVGDAIIIAAAEADVAMLAAQDSNNRKAGAVTKSGNYILCPDATIQVFTLEGSTGAWEFNTGNGYIYAASATSNNLKTQTNNDDNGKWNIVVDSAGTTMTASASTNRNALRYNAESNLFSCYASNTSQSAIALYKYTEEVTLTPLATPVVTATVQNVTEIVVEWNAVENAGSYKVTCGDQNATVEGETTYTFTGLGYNTEYTISVMAIPSDATLYAPSTGTATATTGENPNVVSGTAVYDFTANANFTNWNSSYTKRTFTYDEGEVIFTSANKQSGTITNMPVTKGQPVEFKLTNGANITKATLTCKQWTTKAQTITMHYSTNGGSTYTSTNVKSSNFTISNDALPAGTNAIKFTFSSSSNQIGIQSLEISYE